MVIRHWTISRCKRDNHSPKKFRFW